MPERVESLHAFGSSADQTSNSPVRGSTQQQLDANHYTCTETMTIVSEPRLAVPAVVLSSGIITGGVQAIYKGRKKMRNEAPCADHVKQDKALLMTFAEGIEAD